MNCILLKKLNQEKKKYSAYDKELLSIYLIVKKLEHYLYRPKTSLTFSFDKRGD